MLEQLLHCTEVAAMPASCRGLSTTGMFLQNCPTPQKLMYGFLEKFRYSPNIFLTI